MAVSKITTGYETKMVTFNGITSANSNVTLTGLGIDLTKWICVYATGEVSGQTSVYCVGVPYQYTESAGPSGGYSKGIHFIHERANASAANLNLNITAVFVRLMS